MQYKEWIFSVARAQSEQALAVVTLYTEGVYIEDYADIREQVQAMAHCDLIEGELLEKDNTQVLLHVYTTPNDEEAVRLSCEQLKKAGISYKLETDTVEEEDFANSWKQYYHPIDIGPFLVVPMWEQATREDRINISLNPGMAFGHGGHETTKLCLLQLAQYVKPDMRVLDVGTGSGILAIAAAKLGAKEVCAVDIDEVAVGVARENIAHNAVEGVVTTFVGDLASQVAGRFDIVCANIVASAIERLTPQIVPLLNEGGLFISSGIIEEKSDGVKAVLEQNGLNVIGCEQDGGWVAFCARAFGNE